MLREKVKSEFFVPVVGDGAISTSKWGEGRLIPVVIVDVSNNFELRNLIDVHQHTPPGDVETTWARKRFDDKYIFLKMEFFRPVSTTIYLPFRLSGYADLVGGIIKSRAMYLQPHESGRSVSDGVNNPKILVEVAAVFEQWVDVYRKTMVKRYRALKHSKKDALNLADEHMKRAGEIWDVHVRR